MSECQSDQVATQDEPSHIPNPSVPGRFTQFLLWLAVMLPLVVLRVLLENTFRTGMVARLIGVGLIVIASVLLGLVAFDTVHAGCKSTNLWILLGLGTI